jgi:deoxyribodipyrimidine photolyase-related protein
MSSVSVGIILPHQLFKKHPVLTITKKIILYEDPYFFTGLEYHKSKLVLHRASMRAYADWLISTGYVVTYLTYQDDLAGAVAKHEQVIMTDVLEKELITHYEERFKRQISFLPTPMFVTPEALLKKYFATKKAYRMATFYMWQRKRLKILVDGSNSPIGGKWSFDEENRQKLEPGKPVPPINVPVASEYVNEAKKYVEKNFAKHPGTGYDFIYPVTHDEAQACFDDFLKNRFAHFGKYQDAITPTEAFLYHSLISASLNNGLLTPADVVQQALTYAKQHQIALASVEGFVRQIIGWREFVYGLYLCHDQPIKKLNFWKHTQPIPDAFYSATTGLKPVDDVIKRVMRYAYAHHIERLMILGNSMLLCELSPHDVCRWFRELFIDAYDWVMLANVYSMSQYADGGLLASKPYISSSNYIHKMSSYKKEPWSDVWDALYWRFIFKHQDFFSRQQRLVFTAHQLKKMPEEKLKKHLHSASEFLKKLHK